MFFRVFAFGDSKNSSLWIWKRWYNSKSMHSLYFTHLRYVRILLPPCLRLFHTDHIHWTPFKSNFIRRFPLRRNPNYYGEINSIKTGVFSLNGRWQLIAEMSESAHQHSWRSVFCVSMQSFQWSREWRRRCRPSIIEQISLESLICQVLCQLCVGLCLLRTR